jgi:hypothetical protein
MLFQHFTAEKLFTSHPIFDRISFQLPRAAQQQGMRVQLRENAFLPPFHSGKGFLQKAAPPARPIMSF